MPLVQIKTLEGGLSDAQKKEVIRKVTDAIVSVIGENLRGVTWVLLEEVKGGQWGIGGKGITLDDVRQLAAGKPSK